MTGPGPDEEETLENIERMITNLKPYIQSRIQENYQLVQVMEIFPSGETGYKTPMSLSRLLRFVRTLIKRIESDEDRSPSGRRSSSNLLNAERLIKALLYRSSFTRSALYHDILALIAILLALFESHITSLSIINSGDFKKSVSEIQYHDLRYLENQFHTHEEPTVLVRKHAVLISLNPLRAIVTADRMILIVPDGADSLLHMLHDYMHGKSLIAVHAPLLPLIVLILNSPTH